MRSLLLIVGATALVLSACSTTGGYNHPASQPEPTHEKFISKKPQRGFEQDYQDKVTWGERAFYAFMSKPSFSPIRLRDAITTSCGRRGYENQSRGCYLYAKQQFQAGAYEGYGRGVYTLGYGFGWVEKKTRPSRNIFIDGFRGGQNNE